MNNVCSHYYSSKDNIVETLDFYNLKSSPITITKCPDNNELKLPYNPNKEGMDCNHYQYNTYT